MSLKVISKTALQGEFLSYLLTARIDLDFETTSREPIEEFVNVYLAGILVHFLTHIPKIRCETDLQNRIISIRQAYRVKKEQADGLLLKCSLFPNFSNVRYEPTMGEMRDKSQRFYWETARHGEKLRLNGQVIKVFDTLAKDIDMYIQLLNYIRVEIFNLTQKISDMALRDIMRIAELEYNLRKEI